MSDNVERFCAAVEERAGDWDEIGPMVIIVESGHARAMLRVIRAAAEARSALDRHLGDTDPIDDMTDEEIADYEPDMWACMVLSRALTDLPGGNALHAEETNGE